MTIALKADQEIFKKYWNKKTTPQQAAALALGVHPETMVRFEKFLSDNPDFTEDALSEEDKKFWYDIQNLGDHELWGCYSPGQLLRSYRELMTDSYWNGDRKGFLMNLYEKGIPEKKAKDYAVYPEFIQFVKAQDDKSAKWPDKWDHYKEPSQYFLNREILNFSAIRSPEEAVIALYGLVPEYELRCDDFRNRWDEISYEEKFYFSARYDALNSDPLFYKGDGLHRLMKLINEDTLLPNSQRKLPEWTGNFADYLQALYDAGVIFAEHMDNTIRRFYPGGLQYSLNAKPLKMYNKWSALGSWSFAQAACLYAGKEPEVSGFELINLRNDKYFFNPREVLNDLGQAFSDTDNIFDDRNDENSCTPESPDEMENIRYRALCHVRAKTLIPLDFPGNGAEMCFSPQVISEWFIQNTVTEPLPALVEVLGLKATKRRLRTGKGQADCRKWLADIFLNDPRKELGMTKVSLCKEAEEKYNIAPNWFNRNLYKELARQYPAWTDPGAPRKVKQTA